MDKDRALTLLDKLAKDDEIQEDVKGAAVGKLLTDEVFTALMDRLLAA